jgi:cardiolipin synthase
MSFHQVLLLGIFLLHLAVIVRAIMVEGRDPYARLAWVMALLLFPILGIFAYAMFGEPWMSARFRRKANRVFKQLERLPTAAVREGVSLERLPKHLVGSFRTCEALSQSSSTQHNAVRLAEDSNAAIDMLVEDIADARDSVHISFYIWLTDNNGLKVVEAVRAAASRGVTCRITVDAIGSRALIHSEHWRRMKETGVQLCASLSAPTGLRSIAARRLDLRNHRKIVVIDNQITYCGSQNCADPEFLPKARFAPWVDIMLRFTGPVAIQNQLIFASAWTVETGEDLAGWLERADPPQGEGDVLAVAFATGPLSVKGAMSNAFVSVIYAAEQEVVISTPYFVPDPPLLAAIISCARRGVKTSLVLPKRNDSRVIGAISRGLYPQMIAAGVRIFEYGGGLLHSKTLVADQAVSLIGSANMDRRSLELNFENNILLYSDEVSRQIRQRQSIYLAASVEITKAEVDHRSFGRRFMENVMTMASAVY